ncbi:hypothetical protein NQ103_09115, partial [Vibrio parahaemolyticus]|nr:hypothetical protein [Vibrio parahaemolyticus]
MIIVKHPHTHYAVHGPKLASKTKKKAAAQLTAKAVQGTALALEGVDNVERCDCLALGVLGVCDCVADDALEECLENITSFFVDHGRNTLHTTTAREASDGGLGDTLDVVTKNLAVTLGTTLAEALAAFATSSHCDGVCGIVCVRGIGIKMALI